MNESPKQELIPDVNFVNMIIDLIMRLPAAKVTSQRTSIADTIIKKFYSKAVNRDNEEENVLKSAPSQSQEETKATKDLDKNEISPTSQKTTKEKKKYTEQKIIIKDNRAKSKNIHLECT